MKKILVTGGAGYIGSHTVRELVKNNFDVVVLDSLESGHKQAVDKKAILEVVNLSDQKATEEIFLKHKPDAVIDFAAYLAVGESMVKPEKYLKNNVENFVNLLEAMNKVGCKYIIKSSTAAVYGNPTCDGDIPWQESFTDKYQPESSALLEGEWLGEKVIGEDFFSIFINEYNERVTTTKKELSLNEDDLTKLRIPLSIYGLSKLLDEIILQKYNKASGLKTIALRYFNVCGADPAGDIGEDKPRPTTLMTLAIAQILGHLPELQILGRDYSTPDGTGIRDYIHPNDLANGHIAALNYLFSGGKSGVYNLGTGSGSSVLEVISAVERVSGKKVKTKECPRRSGDATISIANPQKANSDFGWQAKYDLMDMAESAWNWHSKHPNGYVTK